MTSTHEGEHNASETTPLLSDHHESHLDNLQTRYSTVLRVLPAIFLSSFAIGLANLSVVDLIRRLLCRIWYLQNDPSKLPNEGPIPDENCQTPGPVQYFSAFMVLQAVLVSVGGIAVTSLVAQYGTRVGRKPVLLLILLGQVTAVAALVAAFFVPNDIASLGLLLFWLLGSTTFSVITILFACNLMVIDTTAPGDRISALSFNMAAMAAGSMPSYALGGYLDSKLGPRFVFLITFFTLLSALFYTSTNLVEETFGGEKRMAAREERLERNRRARDESLERWNNEREDRTRGVRRGLRKTGEGVVAVFDPILRLRPVKREDGRWNFRLVFIGVAYTFGAMGTGYLDTALISFMSIVFKGSPEQNGIVMTYVTTMQFAGLMLLFPLASNYGRRFYAHIHARRNKAPNGHGEESGDTLENPTSELSSAHFDVYLLRWCYITGFFMVSIVGFSKNNTQLMLACTLIICFAGAHPTLQSVTAASASPIQAGEVIGGIEMVGHVARVASPLVFGAIQSKTILDLPPAMFLAMGVALLIASVFAFLVRDEDRYFPPLSSDEGELVNNGN